MWTVGCGEGFPERGDIKTGHCWLLLSGAHYTVYLDSGRGSGGCTVASGHHALCMLYGSSMCCIES